MNALHMAIMNENVGVIGAFLKSDRSDVFDVKDNIGDTPLHYAVAKGNKDIVKMLLPRCDPILKNIYGEQVFLEF